MPPVSEQSNGPTPADRPTVDDGSGGQYGFVVVSNRLPVDRVVDPDGTEGWRRSPGGLVTALEPVMQTTTGAWVGWAGGRDEKLAPFDAEGMRLVPVPLSKKELHNYYEGFANATLWPLYHDVIAPPEYHRTWWESYWKVNQRFADAAAEVAAPGATVWVHDYQLQLVPRMLRERRRDVKIGFFDHIPFPPFEIFAQLPWRMQVLEGLLGADVIGFQRAGDATNFLYSARRMMGLTPRRQVLDVPGPGGTHHQCVARAFPISIDVASYEQLAHDPAVKRRAREIRRDLGDPETLLLGIDRLDYTKGIRHRLKAYGELLADRELDASQVSLIQVANPSRERVESYRRLRNDVETTVGRINGEFSTIGHVAVQYLHHSYPREEMVALYLAADVMLVTALRDGMNLVAKEYVASRTDARGVLVLSEFAGAADELKQALLINPHDIDGMKETIVRATRMPRPEMTRRMRALRRRVRADDVVKWSGDFLDTLNRAAAGAALPVRPVRDPEPEQPQPQPPDPDPLPAGREQRV